jgi:transcriptional regulator with XRE-family HTH domain
MENLRAIREKKRITQVGLSIDIGIAQETISAYESGKSLPSVDVLIKLANRLGTSTDYLLDRTQVSASVERLTVNDLQVDELELIAEYKKLNREQKGRVLGFILGMLE